MYCLYKQEEVIEKLSRFGAINPIPYPDGVIDYYGTRVPISCAPYLESHRGVHMLSPPYPDDVIRAGFVEYLAVMDSIIYATGSRYQMAEIGASYGPFAAIATNLAFKASATRPVSVRLVEAARNGSDVITHNMFENGFIINPLFDMRIFNCAAASQHCTLYFPDVDCGVDNGAAFSTEKVSIDVRHKEVESLEVEGVPLDEIIASFDLSNPIDLFHIDIQGAELHVVTDGIGMLNRYVKRLMIASHSRYVEGVLLETLHRNGWDVIAEEPVCFNYNSTMREFVGMTTKDGSLYFKNRRFN
jgi:FkbM family methyltransferase